MAVKHWPFNKLCIFKSFFMNDKQGDNMNIFNKLFILNDFTHYIEYYTMHPQLFLIPCKTVNYGWLKNIYELMWPTTLDQTWMSTPIFDCFMSYKVRTVYSFIKMKNKL